MFRSLIGEPFDRLPEAIRGVHGDAPRLLLRGRCDVDRGMHPVSRLLGALAFLPAEGRDVPIEVSIERLPAAEIWTRSFARRRMRSHLRARAGHLEERVGALCFRFALQAIHDEIRWHLTGVRALGVPLPLRWFSGVAATESAIAGLYRFDVRATLPAVGLLVHYRGWLEAGEASRG